MKLFSVRSLAIISSVFLVIIALKFLNFKSSSNFSSFYIRAKYFHNVISHPDETHTNHTSIFSNRLVEKDTPSTAIVTTSKLHTPSTVVVTTSKRNTPSTAIVTTSKLHTPFTAVVTTSKLHTPSNANVTTTKLFFDRVVKWTGDEFTLTDPTYRIPPRIQRVFISNHEYIFQPYLPLIKTTLKQHPAFEHWFWFQKDALSFANQSDFLKMFSLAPSALFKSDILRYFVTYEFGGVYLDMDFKAYTPLDRFLRNYSCILGREPDPIAYSTRGRRYLITNAFIAMQRHHPFLRLITQRLREKTAFGNIFADTGPDFMSDRLVEFAALGNCTLPTLEAINDNNAVLDFCGCALLPWHWVMPAVDEAPAYKRMCA